MKSSRQAAPRKEIKARRIFFFRSGEQFFGFLFFLLIVTVSVWIVHTLKNWIDNPERMVLSQLVLSGDQKFTNEDDIRQAILSLGLPNTYIAQDVDSVQEEILRLPWIKQASVRKQWPDKMMVHVVEYTPVFFWNDAYLLDKDNQVFNLPLEHLTTLSLAKLYGPEGKEQVVVSMYHTLAQLARKPENNRELSLIMNSLTMDERYSWQMTAKVCLAGMAEQFCLDNQSIKLVLGREKVEERFERFIRLYPEIQAQMPMNEKMIAADLRYDNGIAVQKEIIK